MILVMFSGGADSTLMLQRYLEAGEEIHVHHIHIINRENRVRIEQKACKNIIEYFREKYGKFPYTESGWEFSQFQHFYVYDANVYAFTAANIVQDLTMGYKKKIDGVAIGWNKDDLNPNNPADLARLREGRSLEIYKATFTGRDYITPLVFPLRNLTKLEVLEQLGEELRSFTFSCRFPQEGKACGRCKSCKERIAFAKYQKGELKIQPRNIGTHHPYEQS